MKKSGTITWVVLIAVVAGAGYYGWAGHSANQAAAVAAAQKKAPTVGVTIGTVEKADFPVYLTGLGTVQGFNPVLVRTRVDGQIDKIAFQEGQMVRQGDQLVEIAPPPYKAALDQAN